MLRKKIAFTLASVMLSAAVLSACGGTDTPNTSSSTPQESSSTSTVTVDDGGREMVGNMYKEGLPIVKEQETFSVLVDTGEDVEKMEILKKLEEDTNIDVNWMAYPYEIASEKKNLIYSSGDYPDVVAGWLLGTDDIAKYGMNQGVYIPIEQYIADYAPRMTYVLDNFPDARQTLTTPDGHIYTIGLIAPQPLTRNIVSINKTWLDKVSLAMPKNTDELYEALKKFKEGDMNGNGDTNDEIPMSIRGDNIGDVFGWFGLPAGGNHIQMKDGQPVFVPTTDGFKDAVKYFAKLYAEGLLDVETFTQDGTQYSAKGKEADTVYGVFHDWSGANTVGMQRWLDEYEPLPVLSSPNCSEPAYGQGDGSIFKTQMAITSAAKNPATIVRFMDYVYDEDISIQIKCGAYGKLYTRNDDGSLEAVPIPEGETFDSIRGRESISAFPYAIMPEINELFPKSQEDINKAKIDSIYADGIIKEKLPDYWLTAEEGEEIAAATTDIQKYVKDQIALWVSGESDIEADWENFKSQLNLLGLEKYMEVRGNAILRALGK